MSTAKRKRQKEGRRVRQVALADARKRARVRRRFTILSILLAIAIVVILVVSRSSNKTSASKTTTTVAGTTPVTPTTSATPIAPVCPKDDGSSPRQTKFTAAPGECIDTTKTYTANVTTDDGEFVIALDAKAAPVTVNNFVFLSRYHFYDGLIFHRVVKDFVVQGGDPEGTGQGGPGYQFKDELPSSASQYQAGSVAMANSGANTNGSQFFVVTSDAGAKNLTASYSLFGTVTKGMDVVKKIEADGSTGSTGTPVKTHQIKTVTITES